MDVQEKKLIQRAQTGDLNAFEMLVKNCDRKVLALVFHMLGNTEDAEDVYQDIFLRVYSNLKRFRFQSDFYTWVYRIAIHCAIDYRKKRRLQFHASYNELKNEETGWQESAVDLETTPENKLLDEELRQQIERILDSLPIMQRAVFFLRFIDDFQIKDIAEIMGCTQGTVKRHLFRSIQKAKKGLSSYLK